MIRPIEELQTEIRKIILKDFDNYELKRLLNKRYIEKGFNPKDITLLFDEKKYIEEFDEMKTICISKALYEYYNNNEKLNPKRYYSVPTLEMYKNYIITSEVVDKIKINNVIQINQEEYIGILTYEDIYKYMSASMFCYTLSAQRQPTYKKMGDKYVAVPTIDDKAVNSIAETVLKEQLESTQIILSYIIDDAHIPKIKFNPFFENIGELIIEEVLSIIDGYHRVAGINLGVIKYLAETGKYLNGYITVKILISDLAKARANVVQSFKRASTSEEYLRSITKDDKSNFLDKIINISKTFKDNIALTYEEAKALNKLTYRTLLLDIVDKMSIDFSNMSEVIIKSKKISEQFDILYDFLKDEDLNINLNGILLWIAYQIVENNINEIDVYYNILELITNISKEQKATWKLENKTIRLNLVINYFNQVFNKEEEQ